MRAPPSPSTPVPPPEPGVGGQESTEPMMPDARGERQRGLFFNMEKSPRVNAVPNSCAPFPMAAGRGGGANCETGELFRSEQPCASEQGWNLETVAKKTPKPKTKQPFVSGEKKVKQKWTEAASKWRKPSGRPLLCVTLVTWSYYTWNTHYGDKVYKRTAPICWTITTFPARYGNLTYASTLHPYSRAQVIFPQDACRVLES